MPIAAPNNRTPDVRPNPLAGDAAAVPDSGHGSSHEPASERHGRSDGSGGAAAETAASASAMVVVTAASVNGAMAANRERKQVSAFTCAPTAPRAEMHTCGRAGAGAPLLTSSLLPLKMVLQARFRGRDPSKRRAGLHSRYCTPSRVGCRKGAKAPVELADHRAHALLSPCADGQGNLSSLRTSRRYADRAHSHARHWARSPFLSGSDDSNPAEQLTYPSASAPTDSSTCILMLNDIDSTSKSGARRVGDGGLSPCSSLSSGLTCKREVGRW